MYLARFKNAKKQTNKKKSPKENGKASPTYLLCLRASNVIFKNKVMKWAFRNILWTD